MKKFNVLTLAAVTLFLTACGGKSSSETTTGEEQQVAEKKGEVLVVNFQRSKVDWKAFHKGGFSPRWGTLSIKSGEVSIEANELTAGDFVIDMQSLKVDPASVTEKDKKYSELESHLKSADFFDVEKNPTAGFKITSVTNLDTPVKDAVEGANKTISGNLTLKGKALNVTFPAKVTIVDGTATLQAKFTVNRTDWDIKFGASQADPAEWMISKDIEIGINVSAAKK
ncbi:Polyisoprenoid-binding protein YceI [Flavobacterium sp. CF108]|uniref:YceI family protein n=1 Tax=Flavobacterium sp. CF108 TaxID=1882758 RepID=UPI0009116206|nr:YceI family protein [Flavobacterium sp. CF108]SHH91854.1 Polyisoprenoid-binding protein YceI [Flavobacterium sp. CF108]